MTTTNHQIALSDDPRAPYTVSFTVHFADGSVRKRLRVGLETALKFVERHNISIADMEQDVFENWLEKTKPSGDAEFVQSQWESSYEFHEFCDDWGK